MLFIFQIILELLIDFMINDLNFLDIQDLYFILTFIDFVVIIYFPHLNLNILLEYYH